MNEQNPASGHWQGSVVASSTQHRGVLRNGRRSTNQASQQTQDDRDAHATDRQSSTTSNGDLKRPLEESAWRQSELLAAHILTGAIWLNNETLDATNYHALQVDPVWAPAPKKTARIGNHIFHRCHGAVARGVAARPTPASPLTVSPRS